LSLFGNKQEAHLRVCVQMVEDAIARLGHVPDASRIDSADDLPAWKVEKGSASVYVQLDVHAGETVLKVTAPVMRPASAGDEGRLYRRLLELNATKVTGVAFGVRQEAVVLVAERTTVDLDPSEVLDIIKRVEEFADHYDDVLVKEFGGTLAGPSSSPVTPKG
jgi:hypothetical protein